MPSSFHLSQPCFPQTSRSKGGAFPVGAVREETPNRRLSGEKRAVSNYHPKGQDRQNKSLELFLQTPFDLQIVVWLTKLNQNVDSKGAFLIQFIKIRFPGKEQGREGRQQSAGEMGTFHTHMFQKPELEILTASHTVLLLIGVWWFSQDEYSLVNTILWKEYWSRSTEKQMQRRRYSAW